MEADHSLACDAIVLQISHELALLIPDAIFRDNLLILLRRQAQNTLNQRLQPDLRRDSHKGEICHADVTLAAN